MKEEMTGTKLYIGGLPYSLTEGQLNDLFSAHGRVESARVILDRYTGQSRGFGFVEVGSNEEAPVLRPGDRAERVARIEEKDPPQSPAASRDLRTAILSGARQPSSIPKSSRASQ
jgi:hypothetical protein